MDRPLTTWPKALRDAAYHGPAGDFVKIVLPHTEADPAAMLVQLLAAFGNLVGRSRHFVAEGTEHHPRLNVVLVGDTAAGRKGTSWWRVRAGLEGLDPCWTARIAAGLSTGEGLIQHVRDGNGDEDPGVEDKRLLVMETEFARALKVMSREGNTLSTVLRPAWDGDVLSVMTRKEPLRATDTHVSVIGHITRPELDRTLRDVEMFNGFGNRFLWVAVRRSKVLPEGGNLSAGALELVRARLRRALDTARREPGKMARSDGEARELWHEVYEGLTSPPSGLVGALLSRGDAQVMRLALVYALLDCKAWIERVHLEAALEVWRYCEESVRYVFSEHLTGNPLADKILRLLEGGRELKRSEIHTELSKHAKAEDLDDARDMLLDLGAIEVRKDSTGGRAAEVWRVAT